MHTLAIVLSFVALGALVLMSFGPLRQSGWMFVTGFAGTVGASTAGLIIDQTHGLLPLFVIALMGAIVIALTTASQRPRVEIEITYTSSE